jgi:hypothetical protein
MYFSIQNELLLLLLLLLFKHDEVHDILAGLQIMDS